MVRARTFSSHHGLCGQPAGLGGVARFRPLPPHAGHLTRINAMPSDLPLMSTGFAIYPVPPQSGQLSGAIAPLMWLDFQRPFAGSCNKLVHVTNHEQNSGQPRLPVLLNRASAQSKKRASYQDCPTIGRLRRSHFLRQSRLNSFAEQVIRIIGGPGSPSAAMT
jgi:hypothetical protein